MDQAVADAFSMFDDDDDDAQISMPLHSRKPPAAPSTLAASKLTSVPSSPSAAELAMIKQYEASEDAARIEHEQEAARRKAEADGGEYERPSSVPFWKGAYPLLLSGSVGYQVGVIALSS
jgi:hypothetical protein